MHKETILVYDGSFYGFLCAIFACYEQKLKVSDFCTEYNNQKGLFAHTQHITTEASKAKRVINGLKKRNKQVVKLLHYAFLSEHKNIEMLLYYLISSTLSKSSNEVQNYSDDHILQIRKIAKSVGREKHRMEAFVRFQLTKDQIFFATIEPDFNVIPLITKHFAERYADQKWIIYDVKRSYGVYYDLQKAAHITLDIKEKYTNSIHKNKAFTESEYEYQNLWNNYFKSTNITSRVNLKLHTQHVPKRYWKYLSEKM